MENNLEDFIKVDHSKEIRYQYFYWESEDFLEIDLSKLDNTISIEFYEANDDGTHNSYILFSRIILRDLLELLLHEIIQKKDKILKMVG